MEQFKQIGEALGGLKALMEFRANIQINQRQCCLLFDVFSHAYDSIAEGIRQNLRFEEKHIKWKILELPLREVYRIIKEGEVYIRQCLETKDWWGKAIMLYKNADCVEFFIHNLLTSMPVVIEAIDTAGEEAGWDHLDIQRRRYVYLNKYRNEWMDSELFLWMFAKQYLITQEFCDRLETVWNEDRWVFMNKLKENKILVANKYERKLAELLVKNLEEDENVKLFPSSMLVNANDYQLKRRLGSGSQYKEILWMGESFALRHFFGDIESLISEISSLLSLSHPNILQLFCGFTDEGKRECFLVTELMNKDLRSHIKEICGPRKRLIPFSLPVAVDIMLQIARGMEYLHSKKVYHGNLNPSNILVKPRNVTTEGYQQVKVSDFGLSSVKNFTPRSPSYANGSLSFIWYPPEVLEEQEHLKENSDAKFTEKSDVYSFGMICFEILTGKVPFDDSHLQGDKMSRNIRAGERPLFPPNPPKYVTNLTKRCWHTNPNLRPSFSSICRILRYTKRFLLMNPDYNREPDPPTPLVDFSNLESKLSTKFPRWDAAGLTSLLQIPFQLYVLRVTESEKTIAAQKEASDSGSDKASVSGDENGTTPDEALSSPSERRLLRSLDHHLRKPLVTKRWQDTRTPKLLGTPRGRSRPPPMLTTGRSLRIGSESQLLASPKIRRTSSGHASDSELL